MEISTQLISEFERWLKTLGYAESTVYLSVKYVKELYKYHQGQPQFNPYKVSPQNIESYYRHLETRPHRRQSGALSQNYIVSNVNAIKRYGRYLQQTGRQCGEISLTPRPDKDTLKTLLTVEEVRKLYAECANDIIGQRDRAMLGIYYGCGLRRSEGTALNISDIKLKENLVYVKSGKGNKDRYIPITNTIRTDLEEYSKYTREEILTRNNTTSEAFFLNQYGGRMSGNALIGRVKLLTDKAGILKNTGLHSLRHSIATHLLQSGLTLEEVSMFLGHGSLESTQVYTHLAYE